MMQLKYILPFCAVCLALAGCPTPHSVTSEIEGTWVGKVFVNGAPLFEDPTYSETFVFEGNSFKVIVRNPGQNPAIISGTFTLDESAGTIDMNIQAEPGGQQGLSLGVYEIRNGTTLHIAFGGIGGERPSRTRLDPNVGSVFVGELSSANKSTIEFENAAGLY